MDNGLPAEHSPVNKNGLTCTQSQVQPGHGSVSVIHTALRSMSPHKHSEGGDANHGMEGKEEQKTLGWGLYVRERTKHTPVLGFRREG